MLRGHTQACGTWHLIVPLNTKATVASILDGAQWALNLSMFVVGFPGGAKIKNLPNNVANSFDALVGKIPWRRKWQPTPVFLPRKSRGQRGLVGYSPWGCREPDMA